MRNPSLIFFIYFLIALPAFSQEYSQTGKASFYADKYENRLTASGEKYKHSRMTAAHKILPFGTIVKVTNLDNNKSVEVKINDRGPFVEKRIIDLSKSAAEKLDFINHGLANVKIEVINPGDGKGNNYSTDSNIYSEPPDEKEFYDFDITRITPKGFGVQIGSYREIINLVQLAENLKSSYRKKVVVRVNIVNGEKFYKIIIGREKTRQTAEQLKKKLLKRYPDCFIIKYSDL